MDTLGKKIHFEETGSGKHAILLLPGALGLYTINYITNYCIPHTNIHGDTMVLSSLCHIHRPFRSHYKLQMLMEILLYQKFTKLKITNRNKRTILQLEIIFG
jgi:hypothetical protein